MRAADRVWASDVMAHSEPWLTLGRGRAEALQLLRDRRKQCFVVRTGGQRAGFLVLDLNGPLGGYLQTIGVAPGFRGRGIGTAALRWVEARVFRTHRNLLLCVSSFNGGAQRLYRRLGYERVGRFRDYVVAGHDEILLRKTRGPLVAGATAKPPTNARRAGLRLAWRVAGNSRHPISSR